MLLKIVSPHLGGFDMSTLSGSTPLTNVRHERFAQRFARGAKLADAWRATIPFGTAYKGGETALRVQGHRVHQRREVIERISFLRAEMKAAQDATQRFSEADLVALNLEVSDVLQAAYEAADAAQASPSKLEQLRKVLAAHLARQGKLKDRPEEPRIKESPALLDRMEGTCSCHD